MRIVPFLANVGAEIEWVADRLAHPIFLRRNEFWLCDLLGYATHARDFRRRIVVYAPVSGQAIAILPLLKLLQEKFPNAEVLVFTHSSGGLRAAASAGLDAVRLTSISRRVARRVVAKLNPKALIIVQACYASMPVNLVEAFAESGAPIVVVNGSVTDRNLQDAGGWRHSGVLQAYTRINKFCVQTDQDAQRLESLGAPVEKIIVTGNLKADAGEPSSAAETDALARALGLREAPFVLVGGSTHPGEEEALLEAFQAVLQEQPEARLILAPRRTNRSSEIVDLCAGRGFTVEKRTGLSGSPQVIVLDTMGELRLIYSLASAAFVGGTLMSTGGHNLLEPAAAAIPVVFGTNIENIRDVAKALVKSGGGFQITDAAEMADVFTRFVRDNDVRKSAGVKALEVVRQAQGAAGKCAEIILEALGQSDTSDRPTANGQRPIRILIVKFSAIGDVVMATPSAESLRQAYPDAHIAWLVEKRCADAVVGNPHLDEVLVYERTRGFSGVIAAAREMRKRRFDMAVDLQGLARSAIMGFLSGARTRIGFADGREHSNWLYNKRVECGILPHGMSCHRLLLKAAGVPDELISDGMLFPLSTGDEEKAKELLETAGLGGARIFALAPATTRAYKHWIDERWSQLADLLAEQGVTPVFLGGPSDAHLIERIRDACKSQTVSLAGKTTLKVAASVLKLSVGAVAVDNGLMHISIALGVPTVAVFGPTTAYRNHAHRPNFTVVRRDFPCAPCRQRVTCDDYDCMRAVSVNDVLSAIAFLGCASVSSLRT